MVEEKNKLTESIEDYIEQIYMTFIKDHRGTRITDLAEAMNVSKASANDAVRRLKNLGYVEHERYRHIYLTDTGVEIGSQIYEKHQILTQFLIEIIGVSEETAEIDACGIEHIISDETFENIKRILKDQS